MITRKMIPEYLKYILPTMLTFTLAGIYSIVDGIFVGHAVGDAGLAGINVAYPLVCLILAVGTGLGMGRGVFCQPIQRPAQHPAHGPQRNPQQVLCQRNACNGCRQHVPARYAPGAEGGRVALGAQQKAAHQQHVRQKRPPPPHREKCPACPEAGPQHGAGGSLLPHLPGGKRRAHQWNRRCRNPPAVR